MNKRFLLFVISMSVILFFVNQYFTSKKQEEYDAHQKKQQVMTEEKKFDHEINVKKRTASIEDLPLLRAFTNISETQSLIWVVACGNGSFLSTSWGEGKWADVIYVNGKAARLVETEDHLALYSASGQPEINSIYLPQIGMHDVQVVSMSDDLSPLIILGEYDEGQLFFSSYLPQTNGIILYNSEGTYLPVGIYEKRSGSFSPLSKLSHFSKLVNYRMETFPKESLSQQEYFVLENDTMQVVFSNLGGAIAEINLPFKGENNNTSIVLPIGFDRTIDKSYPSNGMFPNHSYHVVDPSGQTIVKAPVLGGYYPLLRRGIEKDSGYPPHSLPPQYYAFNTISEDPETSHMLYKLLRFDDKMIQFEASFPNRRIIKTYTFPEEGNDAPYCLNVSVRVEGDSRGLWIGSGVPEVELISGSPAPIIKYSTVRNNKQVVEKLSLPKTSTTMSSFQPDWIANTNGYFTLIMDPLTEVGMGFQANNVPGNMDPSRIVVIDSVHDLYPANKYPGYEVHIPLKRSSQPMNFRLYAGPIEKQVLQKVDDTYTDPVTGYNPNYTQARSFHGWFSFISEPFAKFLYFIMSFFHSVTGSWGFSIILLTVVLRIMMYPLNAWSIKSTLKMQKLGPKLEKMKEAQKKSKNPKQAQMEMMAFYKEHKINPFGGCLPLIIQMPFLFGMFDLLKSVFSLRGASFIPGWIDNLTAPDVVFSWGYPIPFIGTSLHALPILLGVVMFFQQKLGQSQNKKKDQLSDQQQQQQKMGMIMTLIFPLLFYKFPSGLNLYWLSSMVLQIVQQWYMSQRKLKPNKNSREILVKPKKK